MQLYANYGSVETEYCCTVVVRNCNSGKAKVIQQTCYKIKSPAEKYKMYCTLRHRQRDFSRILTRWQHFSPWNDVMANVL